MSVAAQGGLFSDKRIKKLVPVDRGETVDKMSVQTRTCMHRLAASVYYVANDGMSPPVLFVQKLEGDCVISLTNQVIRVSCPICFEEIRSQVATRC